VSEARSINRAEVLTARTDTAAEVAEVSAAEAVAAEATAAMEALAVAEAAAAVESAAAAGAAAKAAADASGAEAALAPVLRKEPGGGVGGMAEDAEEIPGRPMFSVGAREELKTRGGSLSSEGASAAAQAERSTLTNTDQVFKITSVQPCANFKCDYYIKFIIGVHLHGKRYTRIEKFLNLHQ
jgi:hypothetical protein